jgi:CRP/FNR family cyclic AMP-dependent transcriptional regulator
MISKDEAIKSVPLFAACSKKEIALVSSQADRFTLPEGKDLIREGTHGSEFFILVSGTAEVRQGDTVLNTLGPGDIFGEIASVERIPRTATVTTTSQVDALVVRASALSALRDRLPNVDRVVLDQIAARHAADEARE